MCTSFIDENIDQELQELKWRINAYEKGKMRTIPQEEVYCRVMESIKGTGTL